MCWFCTVNPTVDLQSHGHIILAAVLVITAAAIGIGIVFFLCKSGHRLRIPERLTTFDNPMFFSNEQSKPDLVDTNKLVANAAESEQIA